MAKIYNIVRDKNGNPVLDKNGDFIYTNDVVGELDDDIWELIAPHLKGTPKACKMGEPKETIPPFTHVIEQENQVQIEDDEEVDDEPYFRKKVMFNDAGLPINTQTGYSSDDMYEINKEFSQNGDNENV